MSDPNPPRPTFTTPSFFSVTDHEKLWRGIELIRESMVSARGFFASDNLIVLSRSLGFMEDKPFVDAYLAHANTTEERGALWRYVTLAWAARQVQGLEGAFVECGCYKGTSARIIADVADLANSGRPYFLYDLFEHDASMPHHHMREHGADLFAQVKARFADLANVHVIQGRVPDSFNQGAPDKIAMLHLDLNDAAAEIGALDTLFDRIVPGGILVLDDFGWLAYKPQQDAELVWLRARGCPVLELPTGQGLVIKPQR